MDIWLEKAMCEKPFVIRKDKRDPGNNLGAAMRLVDEGKLVMEKTKDEYRFRPA